MRHGPLQLQEEVMRLVNLDGLRPLFMEHMLPEVQRACKELVVRGRADITRSTSSGTR